MTVLLEMLPYKNIVATVHSARSTIRGIERIHIFSGLDGVRGVQGASDTRPSDAQIGRICRRTRMRRVLLQHLVYFSARAHPLLAIGKHLGGEPAMLQL